MRTAARHPAPHLRVPRPLAKPRVNSLAAVPRRRPRQRLMRVQEQEQEEEQEQEQLVPRAIRSVCHRVLQLPPHRT